MTATLDQQWRKRAAATITAPREEVERTFADLAYTVVQNKAAPLMRPGFRVGFEIVFTNDQNTRMVGIFVFKVGPSLFYVPTFFINGAVKGAEMIYRVKEQRIVPLTPEWADFLVNLHPRAEGVDVPTSDRANYGSQMDLRSLAAPTYAGMKGASHDPAELLAARQGAHAQFKAWMEMPIKQAAEEGVSVLRRFVLESGGRSAMKKIANTAQVSRPFAEALYLGSDEQNYSPDIPEQEKKASGPQAVLIAHLNPLDNVAVKSASAEQIRDGFVIEDHRKEAEVNVEVADDTRSELQTIAEPGQYDVLMAGGIMRPALVGYADKTDLLHRSPGGGNCAPVPCSPASIQQSDIVLVDLETGESRSIWNSRGTNPLHGRGDGKVETDKLITMPSAGKCYRLWDSDKQTLSQPFYVRRVDDKEMGLKRIQIFTGSWLYRGEPGTMLWINPDFDGVNVAEKVVGNCCKFIEVAAKVEKRESNANGLAPDVVATSGNLDAVNQLLLDEDLKVDYVGEVTLVPGDSYALSQMIFGAGYKRASLQPDGTGHFVIELESGVKQASRFNRFGALMTLISRCALREKLARSLVDRAEKEGSVRFFYLPFEKLATNLGVSFPEFEQYVNEDFGVPAEGSSLQAVEVDSTPVEVPQQRIGDRWSLETGDTTDTIDAQLPVQLWDMSKNMGLPNLFEHGVVGTLVNTYDSIGMVDKWLPDLEQALDRIGRLLFLIYWKPEDFSAAYGSDDQTALENKALSTFKAFGDLTLELMLKNREHQRGSPGLMS